MKKLIKFCGIIISVLVILGVILWSTGILTLEMDTTKSLMEQLTDGDIRINIGELSPELKENIGNILEDNALYDMDDSDMFDSNHEVKTDRVEKVLITEGGINKLDVELGGSLLEMKESQDTSYYYEYNGQGKSQVYAEGDALYVKVLNSKEWKFNADHECLTLYIPTGQIFEEVEVELGAGQMNLNHLKAKEIEVNVGAGQVLSEGLEAVEMDLSVGAGEIVLKDVRLGNVQAEVGAGNCEVEGSVSGNIKADCAMGNVTLQLAGSELDFNYEVQCVTGNITIGEKEYSGLSKEQNLNNNASKEMELDCAMGNIEVIFE